MQYRTIQQIDRQENTANEKSRIHHGGYPAAGRPYIFVKAAAYRNSFSEGAAVSGENYLCVINTGT